MNKFIPLSFLPLLSLTSCYLPHAVNVPMLSDAKQVHATGHFGSGIVEKGIIESGVSFAIAPINHLGIMASYTHFLTEDGNVDIYETGIGTFVSTGDKTKYIADIYAGAGKSTGQNSFGFASSNYHFFIQPGIGLHSEYVDLVLCLRLSFHDNNFEEQHNPPVTYDAGHFCLFQPVITFRGGYEYLKLQLQMVGATVVGGTLNGISFNVGVNFNVEYFWRDR